MERQLALGRLRGAVPALVALMAVAAAIAAWIASRHGPLLSPDSVTYLSLSRNLAAGKGYIDLTGQPNTTFAPAFPALLAAGQLVGLTATSAARLLNTVSYAALVVLAWALLRRHTSSRGLALAATGLVVVSPALLNVSAHAWSEPLFCVVILGFILVLEDVLAASDRQRQVALVVGAGLLAAVGFIIRYAGFTLLLVGIIVLLFSRVSVRTRLRNVGIFVLTGSLIPAIWLLRNASSGGRYLLGPRASVSDSVPSLVSKFVDGGITMFVSHSAATRTRLVVLGPLVVLVGIGLLMRFRRRPDDPDARVKVASTVPLATFIAVYSASVVVSGKTAGSSVDLRIVMPIFVPVVVVGAQFASRALAAARAAASEWPRAVVYLLTVGGLLGVISTADTYAQTSWAMGRAPHGYATDTLASSALARAVRVHAGPSAIVTTNSPWALYSETGHQPVLPTPGLYPSVSLPPATSDMLADAACGQPVYFAWYLRSRHPNMDLGRALQLTVVANVNDGVLFLVHPPRRECRADERS
jgi:hypothetical protein